MSIQQSESASFILKAFTDDQIIEYGKNKFYVTKTQLFLWRRDQQVMPDELVTWLMTVYNDGYIYDRDRGKSIRIRFEDDVDWDHPALKRSVDRFLNEIAALGVEQAYSRWSQSHACGCMGPQGDEPLCPCAMTTYTANHVCKKTVVLNPGFEIPSATLEQSRSRILRALSHLQQS
jgi:hypothetical protein